MPTMQSVGFLQGFMWSLVAGTFIWTFFIFFGAKITEVLRSSVSDEHEKVTIRRAFLSAVLIAIANGILYRVILSPWSPLGVLIIALFSFVVIHLVFRMSYAQTFLIFVFACLAEIVTVALIPLLHRPILH